VSQTSYDSSRTFAVLRRQSAGPHHVERLLRGRWCDVEQRGDGSGTVWSRQVDHGRKISRLRLLPIRRVLAARQHRLVPINSPRNLELPGIRNRGEPETSRRRVQWRIDQNVLRRSWSNRADTPSRPRHLVGPSPRPSVISPPARSPERVLHTSKQTELRCGLRTRTTVFGRMLVQTNPDASGRAFLLRRSLAGAPESSLTRIATGSGRRRT